MKDQSVCNISVFNKISKTVWEHKRVPTEHAETLKMSPNLEVKIIKKFFLFSGNKYASNKDSNV